MQRAQSTRRSSSRSRPEPAQESNQRTIGIDFVGGIDFVVGIDFVEDVDSVEEIDSAVGAECVAGATNAVLGSIDRVSCGIGDDFDGEGTMVWVDGVRFNGGVRGVRG